MASLFIKDDRTAALAADVARRLGTTKTEAVRRGLQVLAVAQNDGPAESAGRTADWLRAYRKNHPLPDREAMKIDKAFYDALSDEENDFGPWRG